LLDPASQNVAATHFIFPGHHYDICLGHLVCGLLPQVSSYLRAAGLSLTGVRLVIPDHALRLPVLRTLSMCTCCRHYPGAAAGRSLRSCTQPYQPSPISNPVWRGLGVGDDGYR
jgi:hypothetical protein